MIVLTCGGTGGHVIPVIALAQLLGAQRCVFIGSRSRPDSVLIPGYGFTHYSIGYSSRNVWVMIRAFWEARRILRRVSATHLISSGGALTFPVVIAAKSLGLDVTLMEQNVLPGRVNRLLAPLANRVCVSFEESRKYLKNRQVIVTGNPIRKVYPRDRAAAVFSGLSWPERTRVLVFGGSQGAGGINRFFQDEGLACFGNVDGVESSSAGSSDSGLEGHQKWGMCGVHITGPGQYEAVVASLSTGLATPAFQGWTMTSIPLADTTCTVIRTASGECLVAVFSYFEAMDLVYEWADVVVSRSGATTLAELLAFHKPAILIPYPHASEDHQRLNALAFVRQSTGVMMDESALNKASFLDALEQIQAASGKKAATMAQKETAADRVLMSVGI